MTIMKMYLLLIVNISLCFCLLPASMLEAQECAYRQSVGYKVINISPKLRAGVWYPSDSPAQEFAYSKDLKTSLAYEGAVKKCGPLPLVIFSHGFGGCGLQSVFFTEELARHGYIVVAPDHKDALCTVDRTGQLKPISTDQSLFKPEEWTKTSNLDRKNDLSATLDFLLTNSEFTQHIDATRVGAVGHSLGGYAVFAMAGGWDTWKDDRIKTILLFSPYIHPFLNNKTIGDVRVPVMYQGAQLDLFVTPFLRDKKGAFSFASSPAYYLELRGGNHFEWTNFLCTGHKTVDQCLQKKPNAKLIASYGIAFLNEHLKNQTFNFLRKKGKHIANYQYK